MKYEITIRKPTGCSIDKEDTNNLITSLVRYGYSVYLSDEDDICFSICIL